jgi:hypothetical protein
MCQLRLERALARRLNSMDQKKAFGLGYGSSIRVMGDRARLAVEASHG